MPDDSTDPKVKAPEEAPAPAVNPTPSVAATTAPAKAPAPAGVSEKSRLVAFLLAFFVGIFGVHRMYVGKMKTGILMLVLTITLLGMIISSFWAFIDWIIILVGEFSDKEGKKLKTW